jgi:hypothetical protein
MWHLSMQASDPQVVQRIVKHRYITEANDPLGVMPKYGKIQVVHEVDRTIATTRTPDGPHFGVVQGGSEVRRTFCTGAGLLEMLPSNSAAQPHPQAPAFSQRDAIL